MGLLREMSRDFWRWYERHYTLNVAIATVLFGLQFVHLTWLTGQPLADRALGDPLFDLEGPLRWLVILVDYTEISALVSVSLVYIHQLRSGGARVKPILYLFLLNTQWLHIFWITDEFVVSSGAGEATALPAWLAWIALLIDYLELPVMYDTLKRLIGSLREGGLDAFRRRPEERPAPVSPAPVSSEPVSPGPVAAGPGAAEPHL